MRIVVVLAFLISFPALGPAMGQDTDTVVGPKLSSALCEGDGCDAFLPILKNTTRFEDTQGRRKWGATLGGLSGALIGEEIGGTAGAIALGVLGASSGYDYIDRDRWEADAKRYDEAWQRGDDVYYNPAHRLPLKAHWMFAGPAASANQVKK